MDIHNVLIKSLVFIIPIISLIYVMVGIRLFRQKVGKKVNYFSFLMFVSAIYSFGYFLELNCVSLDVLLRVRNFEFFGSVLVPTFGTLFIAELVKMKIPKKVASILFVISSMLWFLFITNPLHHLIYKSVSLHIVRGFGIVDVKRGPLFYSNLAYYTFFLIFSSIVLFIAYKNLVRKNQKNSIRFLFISLQFSWLVIFFVLMGFDKYIDAVPIAIMILSILAGVNEIKNDMFELEISRWKSTFYNIGEPAFLVDKEGELLCSNMIADRMYRELKMTVKEIIEKVNYSELNGKPVTFIINNETKWLEVKKNDFDIKEKFINYLLIDITERKQAEIALSNEKNLLETTLASVGDGVISTDKNGNIVFLNRVAEYLTGWSQEEAKDKSLEEVFNIVNSSKDSKTMDLIKKVLENGDKLELANHILLNLKDDIKRFIEVTAAPIMKENGESIGVVIVFRDFSEKKQKQEEILYLSYHDQLTGLYNRRFYEEELKRLDTKRNLPITLIMADVNGLKLINDSFGHVMGDELLFKVANIIKKGCRDDDIIARLGGDEFVILMPKTNVNDAEEIIKRIKNSISNEKVGAIGLSVSFGYKTKTKEEYNIQELFKNVEDHMYSHKLYESMSIKNKTIDLIMNTLYEKSNREMLHSKRVSEICEEIAIKLNFDLDDINQIKIAGLMHDIGKMGIDEKILNSPRVLNNDEWKEIRRHPEIGYRILSSVNEFSEIAGYILEHHESWDGKGYPKGLKGKEISLQARIIAIADSYDAMTIDRPYRKGLSKEEAIKEIERCSGTQFDSDIIKVFTEEVLGKV